MASKEDANDTGQYQAVVLIEDEPLSGVLVKFLAWMSVMVIFVMLLIYFSNYFAKGTECFISEYHTGIPVTDIKNQKWRKRFEQVDALSYV